MVEGGRRELFPLLPGTKCPAGHRCRARSHRAGVSPMMSALKDNMKNPITQAEAIALNNDLTTTVTSNDHCTRRAAMARAAGLAAGLAVATVNSPAYAAETKEVLMGSDSGQLVFVPAMLKICKGDTVKWCVHSPLLAAADGLPRPPFPLAPACQLSLTPTRPLRSGQDQQQGRPAQRRV